MGPSADALPRTCELIRQGIAEHGHFGAQLYVSVGGAPVADLAIGEARPGVPMTPDTIAFWLSSGKPVGAVAIAQLWERGLLELDDRVSRFMPEFGTRGKEAVTIRHLAHAYRWREAIFEPLGLTDSWIGIPPDRLKAYADRIGALYDTQGATPLLTVLDSEGRGLTYRPGGSARGPIRDLGRFYEMLLFRGKRGGVRVLSPQSVEALTARHRVGMLDHTFQHVIDWGLGFIIDSTVYGAETLPYGYGPHASPRTFGHSGYQSSTG